MRGPEAAFNARTASVAACARSKKAIESWPNRDMSRRGEETVVDSL